MNRQCLLINRLLLKPATCGGFCAGVAGRLNRRPLQLPLGRRLSPKAIDTKSVVSEGARAKTLRLWSVREVQAIDGFTVLRSPGTYSTLDFEVESIAKMFGSQRDGQCDPQ